MTLKYEAIRKNRGLRYNRHGRTHRIGGPSIMYDNGDLFWHRYGTPLFYGYTE